MLAGEIRIVSNFWIGLLFGGRSGWFQQRLLKPPLLSASRVAIPFIVFWLLIFLARNDLGLKGIGIAVLVWVGLLLGFAVVGISPFLFVTAQALLNVFLILKAFGGDIKIR